MARSAEIPAICIDGPGGAGKSTFAREVVRHNGLNPETQLIHTDWYFEKWPEGEQHETSGFFNADRFMDEVGTPINKGGEITAREYKYTKDGELMVVDHPIQTRPLIVVEGIKTIGLPVGWLMKIWVDTPRVNRQQRFVERPTKDRRLAITDKGVLRGMFNAWADDAEEYERTIRPHETADIVVIDGQAAVADQIISMDDQYWAGPSIEHTIIKITD